MLLFSGIFDELFHKKSKRDKKRELKADADLHLSSTTIKPIGVSSSEAEKEADEKRNFYNKLNSEQNKSKKPK